MGWERWKERCAKPESPPRLQDVEFSCVAVVSGSTPWSGPYSYMKIVACYRGEQIWRHTMDTSRADYELKHLSEVFLYQYSNYWVEMEAEKVAAQMRGDADGR